MANTKKEFIVTAQTQVYLYNQRQLVVLLQTLGAGDSRRYEVVYSKNLTISRGVDNILEFAFVNQNQKPVDVNGKSITCRILNPTGTEILIQKTLDPIFPITGIMCLRLSKDDIENINQQYCYYSLEIPVGQFDYPVFVDAQGGARGDITIVNSVLPSFVQSKEITIPSHPPPLGQSGNVNPQVAPPGSGQPVTYYSSTLNTVEAPVLSTQVFMTKFTGNIEWQGSTLADFSLFYPITAPVAYTDNTTTEGFNLVGYHPYVRLKIVNEGTYPVIPIGPPGNQVPALQGDITRILAR
jgi:hypothetical protein